MKLPAIYRRWLSQAMIADWGDYLSELEKQLKVQEEDLKMVAEAQEWSLSLGPDPFITLPAGVVIKPRSRGAFDTRKPDGRWTRLDPRCDIPEGDLIAWQMCSDVFALIFEMRQAVKDLPGAVEAYKSEFEKGLAQVRAAGSPESRQAALVPLRAFCDEHKEFLPAVCGKTVLELENYVPPAASRMKELRGQEAKMAAAASAGEAATPGKVEKLEGSRPPAPSQGPSEDEILAEAASCAHAAAPGEVEKLIEAHPHLQEKLAPLLERAQKRFVIIPEAMMAAEGGHFLKMAEIYSGDLEYADNLMVFLESAFANFLARATAEKDWISTPAALEALRQQHREADRSLKLLQDLERAPARSARIYGFARENAAALKDLEMRPPEVEKRRKETTRTNRTSRTAKDRAAERGQPSLAVKARSEEETSTDVRAMRRETAELLAEAKKSSDSKRNSLAAWAGVQEEQYVHLAIVFTDIIGSTALNSRFGDATWDTIRSSHFGRARALLEKRHGWYIKDVGDAVVAVFKNAVDALGFAMDLEKSPGHETVRIKAAAHIGTVIIRGNDIFGNEVNLASRIQHQAGDGGIWMSEGVRAEWRSRHGKNSLSFTRHPDIQLRGLDEPITLWSIPPSTPLPQIDTGKTETRRRKKERISAGEKTEAKDPGTAGEGGADGGAKGKSEAGFGFGSIGRMFGTMMTRKPAPADSKTVLEQADKLAKEARVDEIGQLLAQNPGLQKELRQRRVLAEILPSDVLGRANAFVDKARPDEIKKLESRYPYVSGLKGLEDKARKAATAPVGRKAR